MNLNIVPPRELKTVEIDVEKKIFRVNGRDFSNEVSSFVLTCGGERDKEHWFDVSLNICSDAKCLISYSADGKIVPQISKK